MTAQGEDHVFRIPLGGCKQFTVSGFCEELSGPDPCFSDGGPKGLLSLDDTLKLSLDAFHHGLGEIRVVFPKIITGKDTRAQMACHGACLMRASRRQKAFLQIGVVDHGRDFLWQRKQKRPMPSRHGPQRKFNYSLCLV